jgi:hypothetical protein
MPNQRARGQKLLTLPASEDFIRAIDENFEALGYDNRSQFIRDAIAEKLGISKKLTRAPVRIRPRPAKFSLNDKPNSEIAYAKSRARLADSKPVSYLKRPSKKSAVPKPPAPSENETV